MTAGERVRKAREKAGFSTVQVAGKLNISQQSIKNKEDGRTNFTTSELIHLAQIFHVKISALRNHGRAKRAGQVL